MIHGLQATADTYVKEGLLSQHIDVSQGFDSSFNAQRIPSNKPRAKEQNMSKPRQLKLGAMVHGVGHGWGEWRHPQAQPDASTNFGFYKQQTALAEAARFDFVFIADSLHIHPKSSPHYLNRFEPLTILGPGRADHSHRPGRHRDRQLHRALPGGTPVRFAGPHQRRPRRLERGHLVAERHRR